MDRAIFTVQGQVDGARAGTLRTAHGEVLTPVFMPVATRGAVKGVDAHTLACTIGAGILLANAYHLYERPGVEVVQSAGGLHGFMQWSGALLTDSGGFQVFSLAKHCKVEDEGIVFQGIVDGTTHHLTPERVVEVQRQLGADVVMPLDHCLGYRASVQAHQAAMDRTHRWLDRSVRHMAATTPLYAHQQVLFPIVQGGVYAALRKQSAQVVSQHESVGYAIGGLSVGEPSPLMYEMIGETTAWLPRSKARYLMGVGRPEDLLHAISLGVDMFDCVMPTRNARNGMLFTTEGVVNLYNAKWKHGQTPLDGGLDNPISGTYSRAYVRHLLRSNERLGAYLASSHNLAFYAFLMKEARRHILEGTFSAWCSEMIARVTRRC